MVGRLYFAGLRVVICGVDWRKTVQQLFVSFAIQISGVQMEYLVENMKLPNWLPQSMVFLKETPISL